VYWISPLTTGPDGVIRITGTRVPLETILAAFDSGATAEDIAQHYASVDLFGVRSIGRRVNPHAQIAKQRRGTTASLSALRRLATW
jgi:uncharacterized protein (DUF433 family)